MIVRIIKMYQKYILACVGIIKLKSKLCVWMSVDAIMGLHYEQKCCLAVYHLSIQTRVENRIEMGQAKNWNIKTKWATSMTRWTGSHLQGDLCSDQGNQKLLPKGEWKVGRERKSPLNTLNLWWDLLFVKFSGKLWRLVKFATAI